jgi:hypothetical protein
MVIIIIIITMYMYGMSVMQAIPIRTPVVDALVVVVAVAVVLSSIIVDTSMVAAVDRIVVLIVSMFMSSLCCIFISISRACIVQKSTRLHVSRIIKAHHGIFAVGKGSLVWYMKQIRLFVVLFHIVLRKIRGSLPFVGLHSHVCVSRVCFSALLLLTTNQLLQCTPPPPPPLDYSSS